MGLDLKAFQFLLDEMAAGLDLHRPLTLGRQSVVVCPRLQIQRALRASGIDVNEAQLDAALAGGYADGLLALLATAQGARDPVVASMDKSDFEGASIRHDMNVPISAELHEAFTAVIDGGTLEHVFDVATAFRNCMQMLVRGGRFISYTIANGACGHGFYQFSPELFFRVFAPANGFRVRRLLLQEAGGRWYDVIDPAVTGQRAEFPSALYTSLFVSAERVEVVPVLSAPPQQSDYAVRWAGAGTTAVPLRHRLPVLRGLYAGARGYWLRTAAKFALTYFRPAPRSFRRTTLGHRTAR